MARSSGEWQNRARGILRSEIAKSGISQRELIERLAQMGVRLTESNLSNKLARGTFSAVFLLQCLDAVGARVIRVREDD